MSLLLLAVPALVVALADLTVAPSLRLFGASPSLSVALLAVWSVVRRREEAMAMTPLIGLALGLLGSGALGVAALALTPVILLASLRNPELPEGRLPATLMVAFAGALGYAIIMSAASALGSRVLLSPLSVAGRTLAAAVFTALLAGVIYCPLARFAWQPRTRGAFRRP